MRLSVSVPVLSEHMTSVLPSVSTAGSFLTIAFFLDSFCTPIAMIMVITAVKLSGIAATASATAVINESITLSAVTEPVPTADSMPITKTSAATTSTAIEINLPVLSSLRCKGVTFFSLVSSIDAILPISASIPVAVTTPSPCP